MDLLIFRNVKKFRIPGTEDMDKEYKECGHHIVGFFCGGAQALGGWPPVVVARGLRSCSSRALEHSVRSCGIQALWLWGRWDLPGPGIEPMSPSLADGFFNTETPGKP